VIRTLTVDLPFGLLLTFLSKISTDVGTGLSLGGGLSYLSAQYGLSCDGFISLEVVLPDGQIVTATNDNEYSDLFFFLKGSGGGAGIVTEYTVHTREVGKTYYVSTSWNSIALNSSTDFSFLSLFFPSRSLFLLG